MRAFLNPSLVPFRTPHRSHYSHRPVCATLPPPLILGLNVYTHDTSLAILNANTGTLIHALSKERLTRHKHDAGDATCIIRDALHTLATTYQRTPQTLAAQIELVVANNHHFRIAPYEARLPLQVALRYAPPSALTQWNLIGSPHASPKLAPKAAKIELSHHLAHAFSAFCASGFDDALVLVMDGMGDALHEWQTSRDEGGYYCDWDVCEDEQLVQWPSDVGNREGVAFREAETAYVFGKDVKRVFKRWTAERQPSELPNHSFEEMESVGAVYSRVSAILFGDWNACGKVMGLAPYAKDRMRKREGRYFMKGELYDGSFDVSEGLQRGLENVGRNMYHAEEGGELREYFEDLAYHVQKDLEQVVLSLLKSLREQTGQKNLVFAGGVALNSTLNGVITSSNIFENVFIPPYPGDEGVSIGCAAFGYWHSANGRTASLRLSVPSTLTMPYFGRPYPEAQITDAVKRFAPWIHCTRTDEARATAEALQQSKVVAWFRGRSEFGPRALGNRSILADPRPRHMVDHVNKVVKKRESFRPFAPSVLAQHAHEWFQDCKCDSSPFMSVTLPALRPDEIQAVVHIDGTSRLQTLRREQNLRYHDMISNFRDLTGIPMVLNTSFNIAGEPIVESPDDAIRTFLDTDGIDKLALPGLMISKAEITSDLLDSGVFRSACSTFRSHQMQDCFGSSLHTEVTGVQQNSNDHDESPEYTVELMDSLQLEILELIHREGECSARCILELFVSDDSESSIGFSTELPSAADIRERLVDLYKKRLIFLM